MTTLQQRLHHAAIDAEMRGWHGLSRAFRTLLQRDIDTVGLDLEKMRAGAVPEEDGTLADRHRPLAASPDGEDGKGE